MLDVTRSYGLVILVALPVEMKSALESKRKSGENGPRRNGEGARRAVGGLESLINRPSVTQQRRLSEKKRGKRNVRHWTRSKRRLASRHPAGDKLSLLMTRQE